MMIAEILAQAPAQPGGFTMSGSMVLPMVLMFGTMILSMMISGRLRSRFNLYSRVPISMTGAQVAEAMLRQNGINDVKVISTPGQLTDHYDPMKKTVNLSESVYAQNTVAAAAVAAHECGHALQHAQGYAWLTFRSKMVPVVQLASGLMNVLMILLLVGAVAFFAKVPLLIYAFLGAVGVTVAFALVTLPVEFDASRRALAWLDRSGLVRGMEHDKAKDALFWAAMTYVAGALAAVAQLFYWATMLLGQRSSNE
jgi:Zn-dependent membrane protease YugP